MKTAKGVYALIDQNKWNDLQGFLNDYEGLYENREQAVEDFLRFYKGEEPLNKLIKMNQSIDTYTRATYTTGTLKKKRLIEKAVKIWPNNIEAKTQLAFLEYDDTFNLLDALDKIVDEYRQRQAELEVDDFFPNYMVEDVERDMYFNLLILRLSICREELFYADGLRYAKEALPLDEFDSYGIRYDLMNFYVLVGDYKAARALYMTYGSNDTILAFNVMTAAILNRDLSYARTLLAEIQTAVPDFYMLFEEGDVPLEISVTKQQAMQAYQKGGIEEIIVALIPLLNIYSTSNAVFQFIRENMTIPEKRNKFKKSVPSTEPYAYMFDRDFLAIYFDCFADIEQHRAYIIYQAGYDTVEKLKNATYEEIIGIPGIGKVTVEQLRRNGFKLPKK